MVLNVYDLDKNWQNMNGLFCDALHLGGAFHVGVEVFGKEWSFGSDGVVYGRSRDHDVHVYRQSIPLGYTRHDKRAVMAIIDDMAERTWRGETYDILGRNCCTFARELCYQILGSDKIPAWIDRLGNGLAGVLGPVGITATVAPAVPRARTFDHIRQESVVSVRSEVSEYGEYEESSDNDEMVTGRQLRRTQPIRSYPFVTSQSFSHPSCSFPISTTRPFSSYPTSYPVHRTGPPPISHGVRRFVSAVY